MATISGKRFQITDGASSPTNLFPYTVTEAVYGLSTVISNAISAFQQALGSMAYETATDYLQKNGGIMTGDLSVPHLNITSIGGADEITFARDSYNYVRCKTSGGKLGFITDGKSMTGASVDFVIGSGWVSVNNGVNGAGAYNLYVNGSVGCTTLTTSAEATFGSYISLPNNQGVYFKNSGGTIRSQLYVDASNNTLVGYGASQDGGNTSIYGTNVIIATRSTRTEQMRIDSSGNVGIGTTSPGFKLDVAGQARATVFYFTDLTSSIGYIGKGTSSNNNIYLGSYNNGHIILSPNGTGNVGIGTDSPGYKLDVNGIIATNTNIHLFESLKFTRPAVCYISATGTGASISFNIGDSGTTNSKMLLNNNGNLSIGYWGDGGSKLYVAGAITSTGDQVISSDERLKTIVKPVDMTVEQLAGMRAVIYDRKDSGVRSLGVIAQDWEKVLPESVNQGEYLTFKYAQTAMVSAIVLAKHETEQDKEIARLKARVKELETRLNIS